MIDDDLTERIIAACFEVSNELGSGFVESVYKHALLIALADAGISAEPEFRVTVNFRKKNVGDFRADILVEGRVLLELKAVKALAPEHLAQVINVSSPRAFIGDPWL